MSDRNTDRDGLNDDRYVVSDERLAEIRALLEPDGYYVLAKSDASRQALASAVYDLLAERDDRG